MGGVGYRGTNPKFKAYNIDPSHELECPLNVGVYLDNPGLSHVGAAVVCFVGLLSAHT